MTDEEMVAYLARCLVEPGRAAALDRDAAARLPAGRARRPRARRRDLRARERARPEAAVHEALGDDVAVVPYLRPGFELSKRVAELAGRAGGRARPPRARDLGRHARGVVRADARARRPRAGVPRRAAVDEPRAARAGRSRCRELPRAAARPALAGTAAGARRRPGPARARRPRRRRRASPRVRSTPDHMLRIGARTLRRPRSTGTRPSIVGTSRCYVSCSCPGFGGVARGRADVHGCPDAGSSSPRTRTRSVAAHARPLRRRELARRARRCRDFDDWPLELYKLTLAAAAARARRPRRRSSPAPRPASAARSPAISRAAARTSCSPTSTATASPSRALDEAVAVAGDLTDARRRRRARRTAVASFGGLDAVVLQRRHRLDRAARTSSTDAEWRRSLDVNLTAHFLLTRRVWPRAARAGDRRQPRLRRLEERVRARAPASARTRSPRPGSSSSPRIAALEGGAAGIRANAVNPDAIFGGSKLWSDELRRERAEAHGVPVDELEAFYASRSLLGRAGHGGRRRRGGRVPRLRPLARDDRLRDHRRRRRAGRVSRAERELTSAACNT